MHATRDTHLVMFLQSCGRAGDMCMNTKNTFRQLSRAEWRRGDYVEVATIPLSADEITRRCGATFEEFVEEGLGRARSAGFVTSSGRQFSVVEYPDGTPLPATYVCILNEPATMASDLREAIAALKVADGEMTWVDARIAPDFVEG